MNCYHFDSQSLDELIQLFYSEQWRDGDAYLFDVADSIGQYGAEGIAFLLTALHTGNFFHQRVALHGISQSQLPQQRKLTIILSYLHHEHPDLISESIDCLISLKETSYWKEIQSVAHHTSEWVRGAVLRYARKALPQNEALCILLAGLQDAHFIVIENAIDELDELGNPAVIPEIEPFLTYPHPDVRQAASTAIKNLRELQEE